MTASLNIGSISEGDVISIDWLWNGDEVLVTKIIRHMKTWQIHVMNHQSQTFSGDFQVSDRVQVIRRDRRIAT